MVDTRSKAREDPAVQEAVEDSHVAPTIDVDAIAEVSPGVVAASAATDRPKEGSMSMEELQKKVQELFDIVSERTEVSKFMQVGACSHIRDDSAQSCPVEDDGLKEKDTSDATSGAEDGSALPKVGMVAKDHSWAREYDVYPAHLAFKVYQMGLKEFRCKKGGRRLIFAAKRAWERLVRDFPVSEETKMRLLLHAFEGDARLIFKGVANSNLKADVPSLWTLLEERLCNEVHQSVLQDRLFDMKWNERKESFTKFAQRLRSAALALPGGISEDVLLNRLKAGVPTRLKDQANLISGSFDVVVTKLCRLSAARQMREQVRNISEAGGASTGPDPNRFKHVRVTTAALRGTFHGSAKRRRQTVMPVPVAREKPRGVDQRLPGRAPPAPTARKSPPLRRSRPE